jgi:endonuclease/exonuclease/phosphatase family metal-dependent hydrolase
LPDPNFAEAVEKVLGNSDVACFQEFPLRWEPSIHCYVPDIDRTPQSRNFYFFCQPILNTSTYDQANTPQPLRGTNREIGLVTAVRNTYCARFIDVIDVTQQKGDLAFGRRFPVVEITEPLAGTTTIVVNVYGQSPNMGMSFAGAKGNLSDVLAAVESKDLRDYGSVILAGDFNLPYRLLKRMLARNGRNLGIEVADLGATFPTMTMPDRNRTASKFDQPRYRIGMQLDHIVCLRGASFATASILKGVPSASDHLPVVGMIDVYNRGLSSQATRYRKRYI